MQLSEVEVNTTESSQNTTAYNRAKDQDSGTINTVNWTENAVLEVYTDPDEQMRQADATSSTQDITAENIGENNDLIYHQM